MGATEFLVHRFARFVSHKHILTLLDCATDGNDDDDDDVQRVRTWNEKKKGKWWIIMRLC